MSDSSEQPVIREVTCKTVLNRSSLGEYSMNCYGGCTHGCAYCYARYMERFRPHPEPWGRFVDVKVNAVEALERQLRRCPPGEVFVSSACDAWQPIEAERRLTRECCRRLTMSGFPINALTKSALIVRDLDVLSPELTTIGVTITTLDPKLSAKWEPHASPVAGRLSAIREAHAGGFRTSVMFGPLLPFFSDTEAALEALFQCAADYGIDQIWVDALNPRSNVWASVSDLLRNEAPELIERYQRLLFWPKVREAYLASLRRRVECAARRHGVGDRVSGCV